MEGLSTDNGSLCVMETGLRQQNPCLLWINKNPAGLLVAIGSQDPGHDALQG